MSATCVGEGPGDTGIEFLRPSFSGRTPAMPSPYDDVNLANEVLQLMVARSWDCASIIRTMLAGAGESDMAGREEERVLTLSFIAARLYTWSVERRCDGQCSDAPQHSTCRFFSTSSEGVHSLALSRFTAAGRKQVGKLQCFLA